MDLEKKVCLLNLHNHGIFVMVKFINLNNNSNKNSIQHILESSQQNNTS